MSDDFPDFYRWFFLVTVFCLGQLVFGLGFGNSKEWLVGSVVGIALGMFVGYFALRYKLWKP